MKSILTIALAATALLAGCASTDPMRGQQWTCVPEHVYVGQTNTHRQTGVEYRVVELHPKDPRCLGRGILAIVEPTSPAVREQARQDELARQARQRAEEEQRRAQKQARELACLQGGGEWDAGFSDYSPGECRRPAPVVVQQPQSAMPRQTRCEQDYFDKRVVRCTEGY